MSTNRRAFTLIELVAVIVVLAILAGVAIPRYFDYAEQARQAATQGALGGVRAGVANFFANEAINGTPQYPTLVQIGTPGAVMQEVMPENPYDGSNSVASATSAQAAARTPTGAGGWAYYVDNAATPPTFVFYANTNVNGENVY